MEDAFLRNNEFNLPQMSIGGLQHFWRFYNQIFNLSKIFFVLTVTDFKTIGNLSECYIFVGKLIY